MDSKSIFLSKTFWLNVLAPFFMWLGVHYGISVDADTQAQIVLGGIAVANILMRLATKGPAHIVPPTAILVACMTAAVLSACSTTPTATSAPAPADPLSAISTFTLTDLQHASADAKAHGDKLAAMCYDYLAAQLQAQTGSNPNATVVGAISAFQRARDLQGAVSAGISVDFQVNCAPLLSDVRANLLRLGVIGVASAAIVP